MISLTVNETVKGKGTIKAAVWPVVYSMTPASRKLGAKANYVVAFSNSFKTRRHLAGARHVEEYFSLFFEIFVMEK